jgi:hypothetical protein
MPVPQENLLFVEQASCLFLRMVEDVRCNLSTLPELKAEIINVKVGCA